MENNTMKITQSRHIHKNKHISEAFIEVIVLVFNQKQFESARPYFWISLLLTFIPLFRIPDENNSLLFMHSV